MESWFEEFDNSIFKANILWLLDDKDEIEELKSIVSSRDREGLIRNSVNRCIELYEWINSGKAYPGIWYDEEYVRNLLFKRVDFYETLSI